MPCLHSQLSQEIVKWGTLAERSHCLLCNFPMRSTCLVYFLRKWAQLVALGIGQGVVSPQPSMVRVYICDCMPERVGTDSELHLMRHP